MKKILSLLIFLFSFPLQAQTQGLATCQESNCLRNIVPRDTANPPSLDECKVLDGKKSSNDFDKDLGFLCRGVISRAMASKRAQEPCVSDNSSNPDIDMSFGQDFIMKLYSQSLLDPLLKKHNLVISEGSAISTSTLYGTHVQNYQVQEKGGDQRAISLESFFCISNQPVKHYTPYFSALMIDNKPIDQAYIDKALPFDPVVAQLNMKGLYGSYSPSIYQLVDLNQDGTKDLVFLERPMIDSGMAVCLYQKGQQQCQLILSDKEIKLPSFSEKKLSVTADKSIKVEFFNDKKQKVGENIFKFDGKSLKLIK